MRWALSTIRWRPGPGYSLLCWPIVFIAIFLVVVGGMIAITGVALGRVSRDMTYERFKWLRVAEFILFSFLLFLLGWWLSGLILGV